MEREPISYPSPTLASKACWQATGVRKPLPYARTLWHGTIRKWASSSQLPTRPRVSHSPCYGADVLTIEDRGKSFHYAQFRHHIFNYSRLGNRSGSLSSPTYLFKIGPWVELTFLNFCILSCCLLTSLTCSSAIALS